MPRPVRTTMAHRSANQAAPGTHDPDQAPDGPRAGHRAGPGTGPVKRAYQAYQAHDPEPRPGNREALILSYAPTIRLIASRFAVRLPPQVDINDIVNAGVIGLIDAIDKFDTGKGVKFKTYAEFRIRGAILDNLRSLDWVPRSIRKRISALERAYAELERRLLRPATEDEIAQHLGITLEELDRLLAQARGAGLLSLDILLSQDELRCAQSDPVSPQSDTDPLGQAVYRQAREILAAAIDRLPEKERLVVSLYYYEELTMREISMVMQITESRVSQLHTQAILRLRGPLTEYFADAANML